MKYIRFKRDDVVGYGILEGKMIREIKGDIYRDYQLADKVYNLAEVEILAPCRPERIVCVGLNYKDHAQELNMDLPKEPIIFLKPATAIIGPKEEITYPTMSSQVDYEAELAIVIKDKIKDISKEEASEHILGYTCFNDITARDLQAKDGQWTRAKSFDTFAPIGPAIVSDIDVSNLKIELFQNGQLKQSSNTSQMIFDVAEVISFISQIMTLKPGDIIATGTPPGIGSVEAGDQLEVRIEEVGSLFNTIIKDNN